MKIVLFVAGAVISVLSIMFFLAAVAVVRASDSMKAMEEMK